MPSNDTALEEENEVDLVSSVLNGSSFKLRSDKEKLAILKKGRPQPKLNIVKRDGNRNCNRTFQTSWYDIHKWLCGSQSHNKLFCWPCILMRPETSSWCSTGNDDMKRFTSLATKHAICKSHLKATSEYDETLTKFGFPQEFVNESSASLKQEEETISEETDVEDDPFNLQFQDKVKKRKITADPSSTTQANSTSMESSDLEPPKIKPRITFKTWKELNKDSFPVGGKRSFEDDKIFKWRRKIAKQELKNARLTEEKLKCEIEVLKAKAEYYKTMNDEILLQSSVENTSIPKQ